MTAKAMILAGLAFTLATPLAAQQEQWLQYRTLREPKAYRWLEVTTNPPAEVKLPALKAPAWFGRWTTPLDPSGGRWVCMDRSGKGPLCDRLIVDANGNGRLDDDPAVTPSRTDQYTAQFLPARLVFKGEDGPLTYHLLIQFSRYDDDRPQVLMSPGGQYDGKVDFGGRKIPITLVDGNVNGTFNDRAPSISDCDRITLDGDPTSERSLGKLVEVGREFYELEIPRDGAFIKVKKAEGVVLGKTAVPDAISELVLFGENGHFIRKPAGGEFTVPVGKYSVQGWNIERKDNRGATWQLSGYDFPAAATLEVAAAETAKLEVGEPVRTTLRAREEKASVAFNLEFKGRLGESVQFMKGGQQPRPPKLILTGLDGAFRATNSFEFG